MPPNLSSVFQVRKPGFAKIGPNDDTPKINQKSIMRTTKYLICAFLVLISYKTIYSQNSVQNDSIYIIQDSVLIPTTSGIDIFAIIVCKKVNTTRLPAILFYTTYYQGKTDDYFAKISAD